MTDVPTAGAAEEFSEQEFLTWTLARDALQRAAPIMGRGTAITTIVQCLWNGVIQSRANQTKVRYPRGVTDLERYAAIPSSRWGDFHYERNIEIFSTNNVNFVTAVDQNLRAQSTTFYYGIRLNSKELSEIIGDRSESAAQDLRNISVSVISKGGRPPKVFWDNLWVEMVRLMYVGELPLDKQASIEKLMLNWAATHGHELGEQSARTAARKLFSALKREEDKN